MAKKADKNIKSEAEENENDEVDETIEENDEEVEAEAEEEIEEKVKKLNKKASAAAGKKVDITDGARKIEDVTDKAELKSWFDDLNKKLDSMLAKLNTDDDESEDEEIEVKDDKAPKKKKKKPLSAEKRKDMYGFEY